MQTSDIGFDVFDCHHHVGDVRTVDHVRDGAA